MTALLVELERIFTAPGLIALIVAGKLLLATGLGLLIGLERELATMESGIAKVAGLRTLSFVGLLGALAALLDPRGLLTLVVLVILCTFLAVAYVIHTRTGTSGLTTPTVTVVTYLIGAMIMLGELPVVFHGVTYTVDLVTMGVFTAILVTILLATKKASERIVASITPEDFFASLKFAVIAFIILPFLPQGSLNTFVDVDQPFLRALFEVIDPAKLWFLVVLISGIGFIGYILGKMFGESKGVGLSGFLGGLVSSTAVMSATSAQSRSAKVIPALVFAATIATLTSFVRVGLEVVAVYRPLLSTVLIPLGAMGLAAAIALWFQPRQEKRAPQGTAHVEHASPFRILPALKFTGVILAIKVLIELIMYWKIPGGLYIMSFVSGLADVDAVTLSVSELAAKGELAATVASSSITLAVLANMGAKAAIAWMFGSREFGLRVARIFGASILAGIASVAALSLPL